MIRNRLQTPVRHAAIRPEHVVVPRERPVSIPRAHVHEAKVHDIVDYGVYCEAILDEGRLLMTAVVTKGDLISMGLALGSPAFFAVDPKNIHFF